MRYLGRNCSHGGYYDAMLCDRDRDIDDIECRETVQRPGALN